MNEDSSKKQARKTNIWWHCLSGAGASKKSSEVIHTLNEASKQLYGASKEKAILLK